jgi:hypothetical protein
MNKMKLESLLKKLHPDISYMIFLQLYGLEMLAPEEVSKGKVKEYLDYEVVNIESDFTITVRSPKLV